MASLEAILEGPGLKPPPGVVPNFVDPPSQSAANVATQSICMILGTVCVFIRLYTRFFIVRSHGWEDYTCFIAWLGLIAYTTLMLVPIFNNNAGIHQWNIQGKHLIEWSKVANGIEIAYVPIIFITKLSILLLYLRIFCPVGRNKTWWAIQAVILFNLLFYIANLPVEIWPCIPRSKLWDPLEPGHCINNEQVFVAGGTINVVSDFTILLLPMVAVWRLQMPMQRKIGVSAVFATGLFGCISSIMHLATSVVSAQNPDKTYYLFPVALWTVAEITSGILCGCLICMPNFFRHIRPKIASKFSLSPSHTHPSSHNRNSNQNRIASFVPVRAKPEEWNSSARSKDSYMELGESGDWRNGNGPPVPLVMHHERNGNGMPVAPMPGNVKATTTVEVDRWSSIQAKSLHLIETPLR